MKKSFFCLVLVVLVGLFCVSCSNHEKSPYSFQKFDLPEDGYGLTIELPNLGGYLYISRLIYFPAVLKVNNLTLGDFRNLIERGGVIVSKDNCDSTTRYTMNGVYLGNDLPLTKVDNLAKEWNWLCLIDDSYLSLRIWKSTQSNNGYCWTSFPNTGGFDVSVSINTGLAKLNEIQATTNDCYFQNITKEKQPAKRLEPPLFKSKDRFIQCDSWNLSGNNIYSIWLSDVNEARKILKSGIKILYTKEKIPPTTLKQVFGWENK